MDMSNGHLMTVAEASKRLGVTRARVCDFIRAGRLAATKFGKSWAIDRTSFDAFAAKKRATGYPGRLGKKRK